MHFITLYKIYRVIQRDGPVRLFCLLLEIQKIVMEKYLEDRGGYSAGAQIFSKPVVFK